MFGRSRYDIYILTIGAVEEYVDWYNSDRRSWHLSNQEKKQEIANKNKISVRTLERYLKQFYVLDQYKEKYTYII